MVNSCDGVAIYDTDTAGLLAISAAVISADLSGSTIVMSPSGPSNQQVLMMGYTPM